VIRRAGRSVHSRPVIRGLAKALAFLMCLAGANSMASFAFAAAPQSDDPWWDYQIIMWQPHTPEQNAALKNLGITAGEVIAKRIDLPASSGPSVREQLIGDQTSVLIASNLPWYVDNLATDFYAPYHMLGSTAAFDEARKLYEKDHGDPAAFTRRPSLSDGAWLERIRNRLVTQVEAYRRYRPLFYNLADEPGIADTSAFWDFDVSAASLGAMRIWLRERYGSLGALNGEWGTDFRSWDTVFPETTEQAMRRSDGNFSSWADFKDWMNVAFARAIKTGTDAVHSADPKALAAITGAQTPGWGGYDYAYLANAVDLIEPYDLGGNVDIVHALNPQMRIITTSFGLEPKGAHRVWHELLHGSRGLVLWEPPDKKFLRDDGTLDARGRDAASYFREIRSGIGALLINSRSSPAEIAVLYSPASMRTQWMLDWQAKGDAWARNGTRSAGDDNATDIFASRVAHLGLQGQIVSSAMVAQGALQRGAWRILILPDAIALSPQEADEIRRFVARGGTVIADAEPATYDQHSRRLAKPLLADIFKPDAGANATFAFGKGHAIYAVSLRDLRRALLGTQIQWPLTLTDAAGQPIGDVDMRFFQNGEAMIVALQRDPPLSPQSAGSAAAHAQMVSVSLPRKSFVYDVRAKKALGDTDRLVLALDPNEPTLLALSKTPLPSLIVAAPERARPGDAAELHFAFDGSAERATHILHVDVLSPSGTNIPEYSGNLLAANGTASKILRLSSNAEIGKWTIRVTDVLSGQTKTAELDVAANSVR
jgi:hypothetical protein